MDKLVMTAKWVDLPDQGPPYRQGYWGIYGEPGRRTLVPLTESLLLYAARLMVGPILRSTELTITLSTSKPTPEHYYLILARYRELKSYWEVTSSDTLLGPYEGTVVMLCSDTLEGLGLDKVDTLYVRLDK